MKVKVIYNFNTDVLYELNNKINFTGATEVLYYGLLASEVNPFDPMEQALIQAYLENVGLLPAQKMVYEYQLEGKPPMMTHVYNIDGKKVVAAKGGIERMIRICNLNELEADKVLGYVKTFAAKGHRVLGVAKAVFNKEEFPKQQDDFEWMFVGLISFYDPPKPFVKDVFPQFYDAGINIKLLTGDYPETATSIANETGLRYNGKIITGDEVMLNDAAQLKEKIKSVNIFARMFPDAKYKLINALKDDNNIVAMTGDGVNDGPALKASDVGIAMGHKGTDVARQSADLILTDDDLRKVVEAVRQGRKIYSNFKKAIRYIISIHIPIILIASLPLVFGWKYANIFTPIHVIFLELIMGPTCSIFYEREPVDEHLMKVPPRNRNEWLFTNNELIISLIQGLVITAGVLWLYYLFTAQGFTLEGVRTIVFTTMILSNIFLTFVNRSFIETFDKTIFYKNSLALPVLLISTLFLIIILAVPLVRDIFGMEPISFSDFNICLVTAFIAVCWFEVYKFLYKK